MCELRRISEHLAAEFLLNDPAATIGLLLLSRPSTRRFRVFPFSTFHLEAVLSAIAESRIRRNLSKANLQAKYLVL